MDPSTGFNDQLLIFLISDSFSDSETKQKTKKLGKQKFIKFKD